MSNTQSSHEKKFETLEKERANAMEMAAQAHEEREAQAYAKSSIK